MSSQGMPHHILRPETISKLRKVFEKIDVDSSGTISLEEFCRACERLSIKVGEEEIADFKTSDQSQDSELSFDEFCGFYVFRLRKAFDKIDEDKSGEIHISELKQALEKLGFESSQSEVKELLKQVDKDSSDSVNFHEFCNCFCYLPSPDFRVIVHQWATGLSLDTGSDLAALPIPSSGSSVMVWRAIFAGGVAGVASRTFTAPLEKVKILAQTSDSGKVRIIQSLKKIWTTEKFRGLFAGNGTNCLRIFPFSGLVCLAYANIAKQFPLNDPSSPYNAVYRMGAGAFAGMFATILTHPMDVIRAKLTIQSQTTKVYKGLFHGLKEVAKHERLPGLYRGLGPTLVAIAPFMAVQQSSYDVLKDRATRRNFGPSAALFFVCGSAAGAMAQTVVYPLDVIRRRMQVQQSGQHRTSATVLRSLTIQQLFSGLSATYLKVMPAAAISLLVRDALLGRLSQQ